MTKGMTEKVTAMMDAREEVFKAFERGCPGLRGRSWRLPVFDRRASYWRLSGGRSITGIDEDRIDESLVHSSYEEAVTSSVALEDTFVESVSAVWRPPGEDFVFVLADVDSTFGGNDVIVVLLVANERTVLD